MSEELKVARTAAANDARQRREISFREHLREEILNNPGRSDWQIAYALNESLPRVRRALEQDEAIIRDCVCAFKIGVPARSLKYPKWASAIPKSDYNKLPQVATDARTALVVLPSPDTGVAVLDADIQFMQQFDSVAMARLSPKQARARHDEMSKVHARVTMNIRSIVEDRANLKQQLADRDNEIKALVHSRRQAA